MGAAPAAFAAPGDVCEPLSSGKIDTTGDPATVTLTAPDGMVITGYCVKAGSAKQGDGPVYVELDRSQWVSAITISHPTGKAVSHYSFSLGTPAPAPNPELPAPNPELPAPNPEAPAPNPEVPAPGAPGQPAPEAPGQPAQGAPATAPESPTSGAGEAGNGPQSPGGPTAGLGAPVTGPSQEDELSAQGAASAGYGSATEAGASANRGMNIDSAAHNDAAEFPVPAMVGGIAAALFATGLYAVRRKLVRP